MKHEARKITKIVTIACGWGLAHQASTQILKAVTTQLYEDNIRPDLILSSFSAVLDFVRIVGTTFLIEKLSRKGVSSEAKTFIYLTIAAIAFLTECCNYRIDKDETKLDELSSRSLLADRSNQLIFGPMQELFLNTIAFKGVISLGAIAANYFIMN